MNAWSHLPNARVIDWVIDSVKSNPKQWETAYDAARGAARHGVYDAARGVTWDAAYSADRGEAYDAARGAAWDVTWNAAPDTALAAAYNAARDAVSALVVYDDADQYLSMSYSELKLLALLSEGPAAILLLPIKWIQEHTTN